MTVGSLFSGIGGIEIGLEACGLGPVIWQCDNDPHARAVLAHRWPSVRRFNDVREIDESCPPPDIICGGFPCQDISLAGKGAGIEGERSGLWSEFARIVRALRPSIVFVENVAALVNRGLDRVLGDLAALGFDAEWDVFRASDVGAPHRRERIFLLAYSDGQRIRQFAERGLWSGEAEREAEREHAEPVDAGAAVADADSTAWEEQSNPPGRCTFGGTSPHRGCDRSNDSCGDVADAAGVQQGQGQQSTAGGYKARYRGEAGTLAHAVRGGRGPSQRNIRTGKRDADGRGEDMADPDGFREQQSEGLVADQPGRSRDSSEGHRFPPGPVAIAGWDGPQPAVRRGDDGFPGRSHRLRLLGNSVVPQQAALAWRTLIARAAEPTRGAA